MAIPFSCDYSEIWSCGAGTEGQLLNNKFDDLFIFNKNIINFTFNSIVAGGSHCLALSKNNQLYVCGSNASKQLGLHSINQNKLSTLTICESISHISFKQIAAGWETSFAISENGILFGWGCNNFNQLGIVFENNNHNNHNHKTQHRMNNYVTIPTIIETQIKIKNISCGWRHCLALSEMENVLSWGNGKYGQLGHANYNNVNKPTIINNLENREIIQIVCGFQHSVCLDKHGGIYTFGDNKFGQLGNDSEIIKTNSPELINFARNNNNNNNNTDQLKFNKILSGWHHSIACIENNGKIENRIFIWGRGDYGAQGDGLTQNNRKPKQLKIGQDEKINIQYIECGSEHNLLILEEKMVEYGDGDGMNMVN
eukprot:TRINITY_DN107_c0_g2_i4.p1 TRINITY_DN107_c0_g2~~TRINITY_DN107_c0_g2_i4.p1  ORF type:complete len:386 (-),score=128.27 TRINITY_DN107_c0_g2_i4:149-1255(-)